jgi:hypothetical protein
MRLGLAETLLRKLITETHIIMLVVARAEAVRLEIWKLRREPQLQLLFQAEM